MATTFKKKNNYGIYHSFFYQDMEDFREAYKEENGEDPTDTELVEYTVNLCNIYFDDLISEIEFFENNHGKKKYVTCGTVGRWNDPAAGGAIREGLVPIIRGALKDCDEFKIEFVRGILKITGHHHDGTNVFYVREMTERGVAFEERNRFMDDRTLHNKLFKSSHYTHRVSLFDTLYFGIA